MSLTTENDTSDIIYMWHMKITFMIMWLRFDMPEHLAEVGSAFLILYSEYIISDNAFKRF
jgi:hypothetical protein